VVAAFASQGRWLAKPCHKAQAIRSGLHLNWLVWAARIYFSQFRDVDENATPCERLITVLEEFLADTFAGFTLMPIIGLRRAFTSTQLLYATVRLGYLKALLA
jgi:hypothetical protein